MKVMVMIYDLSYIMRTDISQLLGMVLTTGEYFDLVDYRYLVVFVSFGMDDYLWG
jgi:hypothetical protein